MNWKALYWQQFGARTRKERIAARVLVDNERGRLHNHDREHGTKLLLKWTTEITEGFVMPEPEIEDGVEMPSDEAVAPAAPKRRGRPKGTTTKPAENEQLLRAVEFVGIVETDAFENSKYAKLSQNLITAYSNVLAAGFPIAEEIHLCPQIDKLKAALNKCGRSLAITETEGGQISIKGDKLRALVPCLAEPLPDIAPDMPQVQGDFDILKEAFKAACTVADDKQEKLMYASVLVDPNTVTATNGKVLLQFWHGIAGLPPATVVPVAFAKLVAGIKYKITGIGGAWSNELGALSSMTIWFENGAWLKTQCFDERWQAFQQLLDVPTDPKPVPDGLFEGVSAVEPFCKDSGAVHFADGAVQSHAEASAGAVYTVKDLPPGKIFHAKLIKQVSPYVKSLDLFSSTDRAYFFGGTEANPVRGVFMGMTGSQ